MAFLRSIEFLDAQGNATATAGGAAANTPILLTADAEHRAAVAR